MGTQTLLFDIIKDNIQADSEDMIYDLLDQIVRNDHEDLQKVGVAAMLKHDASLKGFGLGEGVAIINTKSPVLNRKITGFLRLKTPVMFRNLPDRHPVDLMAFVFSPSHHGPLHLRRLARMSRFFRNRALCRKLRDVENRDGLEVLLHPQTQNSRIAA